MRSASCRDWEGESPCPANSADQREMEAEAAEATERIRLRITDDVEFEG